MFTKVAGTHLNDVHFRQNVGLQCVCANETKKGILIRLCAT